MAPTRADDPDFTGRTDRVFQAGLVAPNLRFVRLKYGPEVEARLYEVWGVSREDAADHERWITYDTALALNKAIVEVTGDPEILFKAGLMHAETSELGPLFYVAKLLASPRAVYARLPAMSRNMSRITHFELLDLSDTEARFAFHVGHGYPDHPLFDQKRRGTLAAIPMSFDLPPAIVEEETCINRGDPVCTYRVRWRNPGSRWTLALVLSAVGGVSGAVFDLAVAGHPWWGAMGGILLGLAYLPVHLLFRRLRLARDRMRDQQGEIDALQDMAEAREEQAARLEVLREISTLLIRSVEEQDLVRTATALICERLGFSRVIFWRVEGERLVAAGGAGISADLAAQLDRFWLPVHPELAGRPDDLPLFGLVLQAGEGRRVHDVAAFRAELTPRGQALLDVLDPGPFAVVPILVEGVGVGLLAADRGSGGGPVSDADQSMLQQVANQIGLALDNVRMLEALKREKQKAEAALLLNQKYSLYLPAPVVERLREDPEHADSLGGIPIRATVLFSDIKGFTQWAKDRDPQAVVAGLNRYFGAMDEVIASTGGIVDKRMGDGLMVVFLHPEGVDTGFFEQDLASGGADQPPPRHPAARALDCALRMQQAVAALAAGDAATGFPGLSVRIGVAHGSLVAGNLGSRHRIEYTVVGDVVNVASRLEQLCPPGEVLTTAATLQCAAGEPLCAEPFGERELDGREGAVALALVRRCG